MHVHINPIFSCWVTFDVLFCIQILVCSYVHIQKHKAMYTHTHTHTRTHTYTHTCTHTHIHALVNTHAVLHKAVTQMHDS